jgi:hypothetical protein
MSPAFTFDRENGKAILKVFGWTMSSAIVVLAIDMMGVIEVPAQYAFLVPVVNTILYSIKEYVTEQRR